jgi:hypothetical protein
MSNEIASVSSNGVLIVFNRRAAFEGQKSPSPNGTLSRHKFHITVAHHVVIYEGGLRGYLQSDRLEICKRWFLSEKSAISRVGKNDPRRSRDNAHPFTNKVCLGT